MQPFFGGGRRRADRYVRRATSPRARPTAGAASRKPVAGCLLASSASSACARTRALAPREPRQRGADRQSKIVLALADKWTSWWRRRSAEPRRLGESAVLNGREAIAREDQAMQLGGRGSILVAQPGQPYRPAASRRAAASAAAVSSPTSRSRRAGADAAYSAAATLSHQRSEGGSPRRV